MSELIEQPWGDHRIKMSGVFIGCVFKENADTIMGMQDEIRELSQEVEFHRTNAKAGFDRQLRDQKEIERLTKQRDELLGTLKVAKEKLAVYRKHSDGEYQGGMEHMALMGRIDEAIAKAEIK